MAALLVACSRSLLQPLKRQLPCAGITAASVSSWSSSSSSLPRPRPGPRVAHSKAFLSAGSSTALPLRAGAGLYRPLSTSPPLFAPAGPRRSFYAAASTTATTASTSTSTSTSTATTTAPAAAAPPDDSKPLAPAGRRVLPKRQSITITERAAARISEILENNNEDKVKEGGKKAVGVRLGVRRRGCNGMSYTLNYADEAPKGDEEVSAFGVRVFVDPKAIFSVVGTVMDWEETELSSEFTFVNPNEKGRCGCGESFNV